jgi:hypothetical protein
MSARIDSVESVVNSSRPMESGGVTSIQTAIARQMLRHSRRSRSSSIAFSSVNGPNAGPKLITLSK